MSRNLLDQETSPYLLQHRDNPVHWRPWGPDALAEAVASDRPILLSVGYAACHWCHVMAHESFENEDMAKLVNELYIPIKVDREERPDIDVIYQSALSMLGQQGGWPLTMFLTPTAEPFWGGTYFPPTPRYGRPSFRDVLVGVAEAYRATPEKIDSNVAALRDALARNSESEGGGLVDMELLDRAARGVLKAVDPVHGGLSGAPKFPQVPLFAHLWRAGLRNGDDRCKQAVTMTLERMSQGGIYDHLGGGFARYSTDQAWLAPHFEKMLYDNAQMVELLTLVWQESRDPLFAVRVEETIDWVLREMIAEHEAFAATIDADAEGVEGKFTVWRYAEIEELLPDDLGADFIQAYDVTPSGNWEGKTILNRSQPQPTGGPDFEERLARARAILLEVRSHRVPPGRDDKILADWNGMMIAAMTTASFVFGRPDWLDAARRAFAGVAEQMSRNGRLAHSTRKGRLQAEAMLDDYAQMARAALALYQATAEEPYLHQAEAWVAVADHHYWDTENGGYFFTADDAAGLILRTKSAQDNATPSGNGVMVEVLARLYHLTGQDRYRQRAEDTVDAFSGELASSFPSMSTLLGGWELLNEAVQVVVVGQPDDAQRQALLRAVADSSQPNLVLSALLPGQSLPPGHPAGAKVKGNGAAVAFVCSGPVCTPPLSDPKALRDLLNAR